MRITYRARGVKEYWAARWEEIPADSPMEKPDAYPLKYALMTAADPKGRILEAGCGAGRILRYFHAHGRDIVGMDYIDVAISKLKVVDPSLQVETGDITQLAYPDSSFRYVLAFGLYHNLETGLDQAVGETWRVLEPGGKVCASFRADNLQTRLTDWLAARKKGKQTSASAFHKLNLTRAEFENLFRRAGFETETVMPVENMPILYKFAIFRAASHRKFDESKGRVEGYRLAWYAQILQKLMMRLLPDQFCNIYVLIARKPA